MTLGRRGEGWVLAQGVLALGYLLARPLGPRWPLPIRIVAGVLAAPLLATGAIFLAYGFAAQGTRLTMLPRPPENAKLLTDGIYGCVRHPIYGGSVMAATAGALITGNVGRMAASVLAFGFFAVKAIREERWLRDRFPTYAEYASRVRRMLPGIW